MNKKSYVIYVHVAPYVKRYLIDNYGVGDRQNPNLIDIRNDPHMMAFFTPRARSARYDKRKSEQRSTGYRTEVVGIEVAPSTYARHGWAMSRTDEAAFARMLELRCQGILLTYMSAHYIVSGSVAKAIRDFYRLFHQDEWTWPTDSIRKIWNRKHSVEVKQTLKKQINVKIKEIILVQLSQLGTISQKGLEIYEND